jgi:hypothetical protein
MSKSPKAWDHFYWHVLLLCSLIFSQPLFNTLGSQPEFLLTHHLQGPSLFLWIMVVGFLPGLLLVAIVLAMTAVFARLKDKIKAGSFFIFLNLFIFILLNDLIGSSLILQVCVSSLLALIVLRTYKNSIYLRTFFSVATFMVLIIPAIFSFGTDVRQVLLPPANTGHVITAEPIDKHPVVVLLLDELSLISLLDSEGKINARRFPNLADFAAQSTWYKYATAVADATLNAVPPILTGQLTDTSNKKLPLAANYPESLFTLLSASHEVNAFETFTQICPENLCKGTRPDWRLIIEDTLVVFAHIIAPDYIKQILPQIDNKWVGYLRADDEDKNLHTDRDMHPHHRYKVRLKMYRQFMSRLESIQPASLNYLHMMMPHSPWMYLPDGRVYSRAELRSFTGTLPPGTEGVTQNSQLYTQSHLVEYTNQRHLLQAGYVDKLFGEILSLLQNRGMFDDALIIVMADHGVSFKPGESLRKANRASYQDILSIPLFVKYPGQNQAETSLHTARTVDVLPTILDALNSEFRNPDFDGQSLLQANNTELATLGLQEDTGKLQDFPFTDFKDRFDLEVKSRKSALANGAFDQIYSLNDQGLLNKVVQQLTIGEPVDYTFRLDNPQLYQKINLAQNSIPTLIRANRSTRSEKTEKATVAVAINGVIRGVSIVQSIDTVEFDFQVMVAPESFRDGVNSIHFYQVNNNTGTTDLSPVLFESISNVELINADNDSLFLNINSQRWPVASSGDHGELTLVADDDSKHVRLTGWSADSGDGRIATEVYFFSGSKLITSVRPRLRYPEAQERTGFANAEYSGFNLIMPAWINNESGQEPFTAIAVFGTDTKPTAGELRYINFATHLLTTRKFEVNRDTLAKKPDKNVIEPGRVYDFSDDTHALQFNGSNWSRVSNNGARWNTTNAATLSFTAKGNEFPLDLVVQSSPFFVKGSHETQTIEVSFPSGTRQQINLQRGKTDGRFVIHIAPRDIGADGKVLIELKFQNAASPKSLGINNDERLLAINVRTIQLLIAKQASG